MGMVLKEKQLITVEDAKVVHVPQETIKEAILEVARKEFPGRHLTIVTIKGNVEGQFGRGTEMKSFRAEVLCQEDEEE